MNSLTSLSWERFPRLILEAAALFVVATFIFDATHYALHVCLNSRWPWLRKLASPHEAHHAFCDRRLIYHDDAIVSNLVLHVIPEYTTQMAACEWRDSARPTAGLYGDGQGKALGVCRIRTRLSEGRRPGSIPGEGIHDHDARGPAYSVGR